MHKFSIILVLSALFTAGAHAANVRYTYQGMNYNDFDAGVPPGHAAITAWFEVAAPLAANQPWDPSNNTEVIAWSISDGVNTITQDTAGFELGFSTFGTTNGQITEWQFTARVEATAGTEGLWFISTVYDESLGVGMGNDSTFYCLEYGLVSCSSSAQAANVDLPGSWTVSQVPLPAAVWLFGSALLSMGCLNRRRA